MINPWTSTSSIIDGIIALFDTTTGISTVVTKDSELHHQVPELAEVLFACISQRVERLAMLVFYVLMVLTHCILP